MCDVGNDFLMFAKTRLSHLFSVVTFFLRDENVRGAEKRHLVFVYPCFTAFNIFLVKI